MLNSIIRSFLTENYSELPPQYPRKQLARRAAILYSGLMLATAFSGLLAAGIFAGLDNARGIAGWQWLFIIEGSASFVAAIVASVLIPDFPGQETGVAKWLLTEKERKVAIERIAMDRVDQPDSEATVWVGLKLAVTDVKLWIFVSSYIDHFIVNGSIG